MKQKVYKKILHIGKTLYSLNVGNAARHRAQKLTPVTVIKIGRKYFTTRNIDDDRGYSDTQYHLDGWREKSNYSAKSQLWKSKEEYKDSIESAEICNKLWRRFEYGRNPAKYSLAILREINLLLGDEG